MNNIHPQPWILLVKDIYYMMMVIRCLVSVVLAIPGGAGRKSQLELEGGGGDDSFEPKKPCGRENTV